MNVSIPNKMDSASPRMILASVLFHFVFFAVLIAFSSSSRLIKPAVPVSEPTKITIVSKVPGKPVEKEMMNTPIVDIAGDIAPDTVPEQPIGPEQSIRNRVEPVKSLAAPKETLTMSKRQRTAQKVEAPKAVEKPKPKQDKPKKEDDAAFLENRLAALRKEVESKKKQESSAEKGSESKSSGQGGLRGSEQIDEDLIQWFELIKRKVNAHWSIIEDNVVSGKVTIIGLKIGDNGSVDANLNSSSGDAVFDRSALRAVVQSSPFPPIPAQARRKIDQAGGLALRFTPKGLQ